MQTFVTSPHPEDPLRVLLESTAVLDTPRLGKQRAETKQIYTSLETGAGWIHHPATKMWEGHLPALATYGWYVCLAWKQRGFEDTLQEWFAERATLPALSAETPVWASKDWPWWFGHPEMVESHRSKLLRKKPPYYEKLVVNGGLWSDEQYALTNQLPYLWPNMDLFAWPPKSLYVSAAEHKRADWDVPPHWHVDASSRRVVFS